MPGIKLASIAGMVRCLDVVCVRTCPCGCERSGDITLRRGDVLYREGDRGDKIYFLRQGAVVLMRRGAEGGEHARALRKDGTYLGMEMLLDRGYADTARVTATSVVCAVPRASFEAGLGPEGSPARAAFFQLLRESAECIPAVAARDGGAVERVARWLATLAPDGERRVPRRYTANLLGMVPETLSRVLSKLSDEGLIAVSRRGVRVCDMAGLRRRAGLEGPADQSSGPGDAVEPELRPNAA
jgi:CRP/FNR family transcriptional regulator